MKSLIKINKKAQAALEFMITYGWAIFVIIFVLGAISYYTFDITKEAPDTFNLDGKEIEDFQLSSISKDLNKNYFIEGTEYSGTFGQLIFYYTNSEFDSIKIQNITFEKEGEEILANCSYPTSYLEIGELKTIDCILCKKASSNNCEQFLNKNEKNNIDIKIKYKIKDHTFSKTSTGTLTSIAEFKEPEIIEPECIDDDDCSAGWVCLQSNCIKECDDGFDNDDDGKTDQSDASCLCNPVSETEECDLEDSCNNHDDCGGDYICNRQGNCAVNECLNRESDDDDGLDDGIDAACHCGEYIYETNACDVGDGCNNDEDCLSGLVCNASGVCAEEVVDNCSDSVDNDADTFIDGDDAACHCGENIYETNACDVGDGCNNDEDCLIGLVCNASGVCAEEEVVDNCSDSIDNDGDHYIDNFDAACDCGDGTSEIDACSIGERCNNDRDCISQNCVDTVCQE
jgi:uncharacterized protein (UPF0333 family)